VRANQVTEFKYVTSIDNVLTKQWPLDKALDVARVRVDYDELLLKQRKAVEAFVSVFVHLAAGYWKSFYLLLYSTVCTVQYSLLTLYTHEAQD